MAIGKGGINKKIDKADPPDKPNKPTLAEITIRENLRDFIPKRSPEETTLLVEDISKYGQKLPAIVTLIDGEIILVDGHGRYEALKKLEKPRIKVEYRDDLTNDDEIKLYMAKIQLGRRNISDQVKSRLRGEYWLQTKESNEEGYDVATRKEVAKELGVAESTLKKDAQYAKDCLVLIDVIPEAKVFIEQHTTPKTVVKKIAEVTKKDVSKAKQMIDKLSSETSKDKKAAKLKEISEKKPKKSVDFKSVKLKLELAKRLEMIAKEKDIDINQVIEGLLNSGK